MAWAMVKIVLLLKTICFAAWSTEITFTCSDLKKVSEHTSISILGKTQGKEDIGFFKLIRYLADPGKARHTTHQTYSIPKE